MRAMSGRSALVSAAPVVFLAASLCLIVVLAWQTFVAASGHRALANRVLHDYADLAATEVIRRGSTFLFTYGFDVATQALTRAAATAGEPLPSRQGIAAELPGQSKRAIELVGDVLRVSWHERRVESSGEPLSEEVQSSLLVALGESPLTSAPARAITVTSTSSRQIRVFAFVNSGFGAASTPGFEVPVDAIGSWLREFVLREPLLPPALASREIAQSALSVDVRLPDGRGLLQPPGGEVRGDAIAMRPWSDEASRRTLVGFTVVSAIDSSAASSLIIGGLPRSRSGLLLSLVLIAAALAVAAVRQLRRERALAAMREDFVTRTSHELRTPVARIRIFTDTLLLDRVRSDQERRDAVHAIDRAARRLSLLVENVLQFSRLDARDTAHHAERTDLVAFVRDVVEEFETTVSGARVVVAGGLVRADADVDREALRQALLNLLDNAWKYGGPGQPVRVDVTIEDQQIWIRISDAGPGVPERDRVRIWEPYVRLDRDRRSSVAGTGIGLAVVRDIVRRHRGTAWVETADSGGAAFVLALPATQAVAEPSRSLA